MYSVVELSDILGISKQATYKKLNQYSTELKGCTFKKDNKLRINEKGLEILKQYTSIPKEEIQPSQLGLHKFKEFESVLVETLKSQLSVLEKEMEVKNDQLKTKDELLKNMQVLLKQEQENNEFIKQVETTKIMEPKTNVFRKIFEMFNIK